MYHVLDSTAFYNGISDSLNSNIYYTTPEIISEINHLQKHNFKLDIAIELGNLNIVSPHKLSINKVEFVSKKTGDFQQLSFADITVIALSLQLINNKNEINLVTDDFNIENVAHLLKIPVVSVSTTGISKIVKWIFYCPVCNTNINNVKSTICNSCGSTIKKKMIKIKDVVLKND